MDSVRRSAGRERKGGFGLGREGKERVLRVGGGGRGLTKLVVESERYEKGKKRYDTSCPIPSPLSIDSSLTSPLSPF